ncbi:MAG: hypothetical protein H7287_05415, partial [Thermoleophilia bacterium]|nr:hypothetical protein [Thermoleophilia bacterium]
TRTGRTGVLGSVVGVLNLGVIAAAVITTRGHGASPLARAASRLGGSFLQPIHSNTAVTAARAIGVAPVLLNEWGYLDFLNKRATSDPLRNARDTTVHLLHKLPGIGAHLPTDVKLAYGAVGPMTAPALPARSTAPPVDGPATT